MTQHVELGQVPPVTLGWRLQLALDYAGLKQSDMMDKFEVSRQTVSRWCNDVGTPPKKFILNEIAVMCEVSPRWLIDGVPPAGDHPLAAPSRGRGGGADSETVVQMPPSARLLILNADGNVNEDATRKLAPLTRSQPLTLRLTAGCSARLSYRGIQRESNLWRRVGRPVAA